ncbi:MAG: DNA polymerase III subunit delta' [Acidobacteriota bacterium]
MTGGGPAPPQTSGTGFASLLGQERVVEALARALRNHRLPHALLFHGPLGVGKATCAGILAQTLNCKAGELLDACGTCVSCHKVARGLHPDVLWVSPEKGVIKVDQARTIVESVAYRPYEGERRVVIIDDAHAMNASAQNALLKTLEEPPPSSLMVLVTPAAQSLLATVRSRCQPLRFQPLPLAALQQHLQQAHGLSAGEARLRAALAPGSLGAALGLDPEAYRQRRQVAEEALRDACQGGAALLAAAESLLAAGTGERKIEKAASAIAAVRDVLRDLLVLCAGSDQSMLVNAERADAWRGWAQQMHTDDIIAALDAIQRADMRLHGPVQPNARLAIEQALVETAAMLAPVGVDA